MWSGLGCVAVLGAAALIGLAQWRFRAIIVDACVGITLSALVLLTLKAPQFVFLAIFSVLMARSVRGGGGAAVLLAFAVFVFVVWYAITGVRRLRRQRKETGRARWPMALGFCLPLLGAMTTGRALWYSNTGWRAPTSGGAHALNASPRGDSLEAVRGAVNRRAACAIMWYATQRTWPRSLTESQPSCLPEQSNGSAISLADSANIDGFTVRYRPTLAAGTDSVVAFEVTADRYDVATVRYRSDTTGLLKIAMSDVDSGWRDVDATDIRLHELQRCMTQQARDTGAERNDVLRGCIPGDATASTLTTFQTSQYRYSIIPSSESRNDRASRFGIIASPAAYGVTAIRRYFLDADGVLQSTAAPNVDLMRAAR